MKFLCDLSTTKTRTLNLFQYLSHLNSGDKGNSLAFLFPTMNYLNNELGIKDSNEVLFLNNDVIYREIVDNCDSIHSLSNPLFDEMMNCKIDLNELRSLFLQPKGRDQNIYPKKHDEEISVVIDSQEGNYYVSNIKKLLRASKSQSEEWREILLFLNLIKIYANFLIEAAMRDIEKMLTQSTTAEWIFSSKNTEANTCGCKISLQRCKIYFWRK